MNFPDWNPYEFLDVGEMAFGFAVAYIYNSSQSSMYAYVMRAFYDSELDRVGLKLLCEDGKISNLMLCERCDLDGVRYNDAAAI